MLLYGSNSNNGLIVFFKFLVTTSHRPRHSYHSLGCDLESPNRSVFCPDQTVSDNSKRMGILDQTGSQTLSGSGGVNTKSNLENDSVLFEDNRALGEFVPDSDERITFPTMPAELENYGTEVDPQVFIKTILFFVLCKTMHNDNAMQIYPISLHFSSLHVFSPNFNVLPFHLRIFKNFKYIFRKTNICE